MRIAADMIAPVPWKNGGGITRDLVSDGANARWRLSLADIESDGPFSDYPGIERWFVVVCGAGVELAFADRRVLLRVGDEPLRFDGTRGPRCRLIDGPTRDLNLLLRSGTRGVMRRADARRVWDEAWPLRAHFDFATRTLDWKLPPGPQRAGGAGVWIGIAA